MENQEFWEIVISKLDRIASLLEVRERREIENLKANVLGRSKTKRDIYDLIDGKRSVQEISNLLKIKQPNVSKSMGELVEGNLVGKRVRGKSVYYYKKFED